MPFLRIISNSFLKDKNPQQCTERVAELISNKTGKPVNSIVVHISTNQEMCFLGSAETKGVLAYLEAIGFNDKEGIVKLLTEFLYECFEDVDLSAINIVLSDLKVSEVAKGGHLLG